MWLPRTGAVTLAVAVLLPVSACRGSDDGEPRPSGGTSTTGASTTVAVTEDPEGTSELELVAHALLITGAELGVTQAVDLGYSPPQDPGECGFATDAEHPADIHVGTRLDIQTAVVEEVLRIYRDPAAAEAAFQARVLLTCDLPLTDAGGTGPVDVNDRMGADQALAFSGTDSSGAFALVVTLLSDAVVSFSLRGAVDASIDPVDLAAFGVGKILAALEG